MAVGADGHPASGGEVIREREQTITEVRFRAGTHAYDGTGTGKTARFVGVHVRRVHEAPLFVDAHVFQQPAHRAPFVGREALVDFALLFRDMQVNGSAGLAAGFCDR